MTTSTLGAGLQGTITLTDQITIEDPVTIDGTGVDITITCDKPGGVGHRAFVVAGTSTSVTLWAFTIYQCSPDDNGGAILNSGILTLNHMLFSNNTANTSSGGAIFNNPFASLLISVSTFQGNQASIDGDAVYNVRATCTSRTVPSPETWPLLITTIRLAMEALFLTASVRQFCAAPLIAAEALRAALSSKTGKTWSLPIRLSATITSEGSTATILVWAAQFSRTAIPRNFTTIQLPITR
jgi:predicted outer membrane repeat protein